MTSYDIATGSKITSQQIGAVSTFSAMGTNPQGGALIVAQLASGIALVNSDTLSVIKRIDCAGKVYCVSWSPDGKYIAGGLESGEVVTLDSTNHSTIKRAKSHGSWVLSIMFNAASDKVVTGSMDMTAIVHSAPDLAILNTLRGHASYIYCCLFLPSDIVATGSDDTTICIWDAQSGTIVSWVKDHTDVVRALAVSPDNTILVSGGRGSAICLHNISTYSLIASVNCDGWIWSLCFFDQNTVLASVHDSELISIDIRTGKVVKKFDGQYEYASVIIYASPATSIPVCWS